MKEGTHISGRKTKFENIIGHFIADIKNKAELLADREINNVVAGRPVHFIDGNDRADKEAEGHSKPYSYPRVLIIFVFSMNPLPPRLLTN